MSSNDGCQDKYCEESENVCLIIARCQLRGVGAIEATRWSATPASPGFDDSRSYHPMVSFTHVLKRKTTRLRESRLLRISPQPCSAKRGTRDLPHPAPRSLATLIKPQARSPSRLAKLLRHSRRLPRRTYRQKKYRKSGVGLPPPREPPHHHPAFHHARGLDPICGAGTPSGRTSPSHHASALRQLRDAIGEPSGSSVCPSLTERSTHRRCWRAR